MNGSRMKLSDECMLSLSDLHDFGMVSFNFLPTGPKTTMPGFTVGIPLKQWRQFQKFVADFQPDIKGDL